MRKTKIICTLGPATDSIEVVKDLARLGMNVARLNFSHGTHEQHLNRIKLVQQATQESGKLISIMLDTKGPEIRIGMVRDGKVEMVEGNPVVLTTRLVEGTESELHVNFPGLPDAVKPGDRILIADGVIALEVERVEGGENIHCRVVYGGSLGSQKGINIPGVATGLPFLSERDIADIHFGLDQGIDFIAASFVRDARDVLDIRRIIESRDMNVDIIAKIECQEAVHNLDQIIKVADAIMVARGDLGVEIPTEEVPLVQKRIVEKCNSAGKPVIIATQMLESMIKSPRPTRAEASDVANGIFDGADAIMLSGETAAGQFPREAVETMARIALRAEEVLPFEQMLKRKRFQGSLFPTDAIGYATCALATDLDASAIITATQSGSTARMVAKYRPRSIILATTPIEAVARRLNLVWGVHPILVETTSGTDEMFEESVDAALRQGMIKEGDLVVITAGVPSGVPGTTNLIKVHVVAEIILQGTGIGRRSCTGKIRKVKDPGSVEHFEHGDILVAYSTDREFMPFFQRAGAVITEEAGLTSHAAIAGISLGIPVVVGADAAMERLDEDMLVTVDTSRGVVYRGQTKVL
ncbi:MAG: pyruvate kinase [Solirubrobacterales bacterium]